mgnify:FL=1
MSNAIFTDTVTLFNHYKGEWFKTVLPGVQWKDKITRTVDSDGKITITPEVNLTVPVRAGYVESKVFTGEGFTFGTGNLDVIVLGEISDEITQDFTVTHLKRKYDHAATIYGVSDNTLRAMLRHWKVVAR